MDNQRIKELTESIQNWGKYNSQSNPGAVMERRAMERELKKILENKRKK